MSRNTATQKAIQEIETLAAQRGLVFQRASGLYCLYEHETPGDIKSERIRTAFIGETIQETLAHLKGVQK